MKVTTAVVLTDLADGDSKEEQDTDTAVDNICYERVPSEHQPTIRYRIIPSPLACKCLVG